jgi:inhibitor of KinA
MIAVRVVAAGEAALVVEFPQRIDPATSDRAVALARAAVERCGSQLRDVVVGYCTVTVYFDPLALDAAWLEAELLRLAATDVPPAIAGDVLDIPVCYGGECGPDLPEVAAFAGLTPAEVIDLHCRDTYRVYVVGFIPGFAYMAAVDPKLALPRRSVPRTRVPAGSVAVAAGQTGIYPAETPGGWHLIGRTPVKPYDPERSTPFLFKAGDRVRFHPITAEEFAQAASREDSWQG